jgi:hypothetical protein
LGRSSHRCHSCLTHKKTSRRNETRQQQQ